MSGFDDDPLRDDPTRLEERIAASRKHVAEAVAALDRRLSPRRLADDAMDALHRATDTARTDGPKMMIELVKRNPIPAALIAAGIGWAVFDAVLAPARPAADREPESLGGTDTASEETVEAAAADLPMATTTRTELRAVSQDNPLAVSALGLVLGALLGAMLPATRRERRWQRASQDWLGDQAEALGQDALDIAEAAGRAAIEVVRQEIAAATAQPGDDDGASDGAHGRNGTRRRARRN